MNMNPNGIFSKTRPGSKFQTGDIVEATSGGPQMHVEGQVLRTRPDLLMYRCSWFRGKKADGGEIDYSEAVRVTEDFLPETLKRIKSVGDIVKEAEAAEAAKAAEAAVKADE